MLPFYRGSGGTERLRNLPKAPQLVSGKARLKWDPERMSSTLPSHPSYHSLPHHIPSGLGVGQTCPLFFPLISSMSSSQTVVPGPAASVSPGNLLEMHALMTHPRETKPETREEGSTTWFVFFFFFLMNLLLWTILKFFVEFVTVFLLFYILVFWPRGMCNLSSPTKDQTDLHPLHWKAKS